jgi:hypothetical protein
MSLVQRFKRLAHILLSVTAYFSQSQDFGRFSEDLQLVKINITDKKNSTEQAN